MRKYTGAPLEIESDFFFTHSEEAENKARARSRVVLETNAANELRLRWKTGAAAVAAARARGARRDGSEARSDSLVCSNEVQRLTSRVVAPSPRNRSKKLTRHAGRMIREGCGVLEEIYGRECAFITLTLPGSTRDAIEALADNATGIVNAYMQRIRDSLKRWRSEARLPDSNEFDYVGVWEYQTRGALHIHLAIGLASGEEYKRVKERHREWWTNVLEHYSKKTGIDMFAREDGGTWRDKPFLTRTECKRVKKSVARYMSKYISKAVSETGENGAPPPNRWWFMGKSVRNEVLKQRLQTVLTTDTADEAEQVFTDVSFMLAHTSNKVYEMKNPFDNSTCGVITWRERDERMSVFEQLKSMLHSRSQCELFGGDDDEIDGEELFILDEETGECLTNDEWEKKYCASSQHAGIALLSP